VKESNRPTSKSSIARAQTESSIVFCGDAQQVSDGFALALELMAVDADLLTMETEPMLNTECKTVHGRLLKGTI